MSTELVTKSTKKTELAKEKGITVLSNTELMETYDYDVFTLDDQKNRQIHDEKVASFVKLFKKGDFFMQEFPAIVNENFVIIDGQHRYKAVVICGLPFYFRKANKLTMENVDKVQLNAGWKIEDYLHVNIKKGNMNYKILHRFVERYKLPISIAAMLLNYSTHGSGLTRGGYYEGLFEVKDEAKAHKLAQQIQQISETGFTGWKSASFIKAVIIASKHPEYDHKKLIAQIVKYPTILKWNNTFNAYMRNLEEVYNYHTAAKNRIRFS